MLMIFSKSEFFELKANIFDESFGISFQITKLPTIHVNNNNNNNRRVIQVPFLSLKCHLMKSRVNG